MYGTFSITAADLRWHKEEKGKEKEGKRSGPGVGKRDGIRNEEEEGGTTRNEEE